MEHQKTNKDEIQERIYQAKTVEELVAIAAEAGETLTLEEATKLLQEVEDERAMAKDAFALAEDLPDEELAKVAGGAGSGNPTMDVINEYRRLARELTYRNGEKVKINFSSGDYHCTEYQCRACFNKGIRVVDGELYCAACDKYARCTDCRWREEAAGGVFSFVVRDTCISPVVRTMYGL